MFKCKRTKKCGEMIYCDMEKWCNGVMVKLYIKIHKKIKKRRDDLMSNRKIQNGSIVYMYIFMKILRTNQTESQWLENWTWYIYVSCGFTWTYFKHTPATLILLPLRTWLDNSIKNKFWIPGIMLTLLLDFNAYILGLVFYFWWEVFP